MKPNITILWEDKAQSWFIHAPLRPRVLGQKSLISTFHQAFNLLLISKTEPVLIKNSLTGAEWRTDFETISETSNGEIQTVLGHR